MSHGRRKEREKESETERKSRKGNHIFSLTLMYLRDIVWCSQTHNYWSEIFWENHTSWETEKCWGKHFLWRIKAARTHTSNVWFMYYFTEKDLFKKSVEMVHKTTRNYLLTNQTEFVRVILNQWLSSSLNRGQSVLDMTKIIYNIWGLN